jgi:hypothetical protein
LVVGLWHLFLTMTNQSFWYQLVPHVNAF